MAMAMDIKVGLAVMVVVAMRIARRADADAGRLNGGAAAVVGVVAVIYQLWLCETESVNRADAPISHKARYWVLRAGLGEVRDKSLGVRPGEGRDALIGQTAGL